MVQRVIMGDWNTGVLGNGGWDVRPYNSVDEFESAAVIWLTEKINAVIDQRERCVLGLSGGSTPGPIYEALGKQDIDWTKVFIFLIDDRFVPADHDDSNQKLLLETLLQTSTIPTENLYLPNPSLPIDKCVDDYEERLRSLIGDDGADIAVLGMGDDGHTASLFPGDEVAINEEGKWVLHTKAPAQFAVEDRITVTIPVIDQSHHKLLLLKGQKKMDVLQEMQTSEKDPKRFPLQILSGVSVLALS